MEKFALIQHLNHIELMNNRQRKFLNFTESLLPLLRMKGHQLETISLAHFPEICIRR
jgi:hypothetical protein